MAETMGNGSEMEPKKNNIETRYNDTFGAKTPSGDISGQLENIRAMESLEKAIENFEKYGLSSFYEKLNPEKQRIFLQALLKAGVREENLKKKVVGVHNGNDIYFIIPFPAGGIDGYDSYAQLIDKITQEPCKEGEGEMERVEYKDGTLPSFETLKAHEGKRVSFICKDGTKRRGELIISGVNNETAILFIKGQHGGEYLRNIKEINFGRLNGSNNVTPPTISTLPWQSQKVEPRRMDLKEEKNTSPTKEESLARAQEEYRLMSKNLYLKYFGYNGQAGDRNSEREFDEAMKREYDILMKKERDINRR